MIDAYINFVSVMTLGKTSLIYDPTIFDMKNDDHKHNGPFLGRLTRFSFMRKHYLKEKLAIQPATQRNTPVVCGGYRTFDTSHTHTHTHEKLVYI